MEEKHTKVVNIHFPLTPTELAIGISELRYDGLQKFLEVLADKISDDAAQDLSKGRVKLSSSLKEASTCLSDAAARIADAWEICEPYETKND